MSPIRFLFLLCCRVMSPHCNLSRGEQAEQVLYGITLALKQMSRMKPLTPNQTAKHVWPRVETLLCGILFTDAFL